MKQKEIERVDAKGTLKILPAQNYAKFPSTWGHNDLHIGRITSDGAALITFVKAPGEVPVHPFETAGQRLVEYLLREEAQAKAA